MKTLVKRKKKNRQSYWFQYCSTRKIISNREISIDLSCTWSGPDIFKVRFCCDVRQILLKCFPPCRWKSCGKCCCCKNTWCPFIHLFFVQMNWHETYIHAYIIQTIWWMFTEIVGAKVSVLCFYWKLFIYVNKMRFVWSQH